MLLAMSVLMVLYLIIQYFPASYTSPIRTTRPTEILPPNDQLHIKEIFSEQSLYRHIDHIHTQTSNALSSINQTLGSGVCVFDYDNDGWVDVFIVGGSGHTRHYGRESWWHSARGNALFRNIQGKTFEDVTSKSGLLKKMWGMGCASADLDNDGDSDLLISAIGQNHLFRNNSDGTFTDVTQTSGMQGENWSTSIAIADFDKDGLLDFYLGNYIYYEKGARTFEFDAGFKTTVPVSFNSSIYDGVANKLYRNRGGLIFEEIATLANVNDPAGRTLSVTWLTANDDHYPDLLITNDKGSPSQLFLNDKKGQFSKADASYRVETTNGGHSSVSGDINNDLAMDIIISTPAGQPPIALINDGTSLSDIAWDINLTRSRDQGNSSWGNTVADFNNDGWLDIYFANGLILPDSNSPTVPQGQRNQLLLRSKNGQYIHAPSNNDGQMSSRGVAYADFNNDGHLDLIVTNNNNTPELFINRGGPNNWLGIELINRHGNRSGFDSNIVITLEKDNSFIEIKRDNYSRSSFLSQSENRYHFGIGSFDIVREITVTWSDGNQSIFENVSANQYIQIDELASTISPIHLETDTKTNQFYKLKPPFDQHKAEYLVWKAIVSDFEMGMDQLFQLFTEVGDAEKMTILSLLKPFKKPEILPILRYALLEQSIAIKVNAIGQIQSQEYEPSIYWLLDMFADDSPDVICQLARTFEFFFSEEEAVTHRKFLAIPYLIRMLDQKSDEQKICALKALSEAERYRGVNAIQILLQHSNELVLLQAIETLGRLRDKKSLPRLSQLIMVKNQTPNVIAYTLIALKRLNDINVEGYLEQFLGLEPSNTGAGRIAKAILISRNLLTDNTDNLVISPEQILGILIRTIQNYRQSNSLMSLAERPVLLSHYFSVLSFGNSSEHLEFIVPFTESRSPSVRIGAYQALLNIATIQAIHLSERGLFDPSAEVSDAVLSAFNTNLLTVSEQTLQMFSSQHKNLSVILTLTPPSKRSTQSQRINQLFASAVTDEALSTSLLHACYELNLVGILIPDKFFYHQNKDLALSAIACATKGENKLMNTLELDKIISNSFALDQPPSTINTIEALLNAPAAWTNRLLLKLLNNSYVPTEIQKYVITSALKTNQPIRQLMVIKALNSTDDALKIHTLGKIQGLVANNQIQETLYRLFIDEMQDEGIRLQIASMLIPVRPGILSLMHY